LSAKVISSDITSCFGGFPQLLFSPEYKHEPGIIVQQVILSVHLQSEDFIALILECLIKDTVLQFSIYIMFLMFVINKHLQIY
jgi:hypothetical protein